MLRWTPEHVIALAPDAASAKAAHGVARPGQWPTRGQNDRALWGECQGSSGAPYQISIDPSEPAFKCSCPSRKFPCKHILGLLLLAAQPDAVPMDQPPAWVNEWLAKREQTTHRKVARAAEVEADPEQQVKRAAAKDKRTAERQRKVQAG